MILSHSAAAVGFHEPHQVIYLSLQVYTFVGLCDLHALFQSLENGVVIVDIMVALQGLFPTGKRLVGNHAKIPGAEQQSVACDTGGFLVSTAEAAVDDKELILLCIAVGIVSGQLDLETMGITVLVDLVGKDGQRTQRNTVAGFDDIQVI